MSESQLPLLRKVKAMLFLPLDQQRTSEGAVTHDTPQPIAGLRRMLRIWLQSPWNDYNYVSASEGLSLATRKGSYFDAVHIKQYEIFEDFLSSNLVNRIDHPNVARVQDIYLYQQSTFIISEALPLSVEQLDFEDHGLEEWEFATILNQVRKVISQTALFTNIIDFVRYFTSYIFWHSMYRHEDGKF